MSQELGLSVLDSLQVTNKRIVPLPETYTDKREKC